jgi:Cupin domain
MGSGQAGRGSWSESAGMSAVDVALGAGELCAHHSDVVDEEILVLEGRLTLHAGTPLRLEAGDRHVVPAGTPHAYAGGVPGTRIRVARRVRSAARYEEFVRAVGRPGGPQDAEDLARLAAIGAVNGITVLGSGDAVPVRVADRLRAVAGANLIRPR